MAEQRRPLALLTDAELEQALRDLGARLAYPPTPDLARSVRARLAAGPAPRRPLLPWSWPAPAWRTVAVAAVALLLLAIGLLALFPDARTAVADRLGLRGVRIFFVEEAPTAEPSPVGTRLMLGRPVTLSEAQQQVR